MRAWWWWSKSASSTFQEWNRTSAWTRKPRESIPGLTTSVGRVKIKKKVILLGPFSESDFEPILVPIFSADFGLSSTEIGSKSVYSDKGIEKRSYLINATPSLFVAISPTN